MAPRDLQLTPEAPWPGPAAYAERDAAFFHGRAAETAELHRLIHAEPVSVLYALSGLGKTSLLCAGVFPRLRAEGWLPVRIRLDHRDGDDDGQPVPALTAQVLAAVAGAAMDCGVAVPEWDAEKDTLAEAFHARGGRFWGAHEEEPVTPVLVFDQFEECWTLTRDRAAARARAEALLGQVAALLDWRGSGEPAPVRVVFALREDQLAPLDALRPLFPGLRRARLRLLPFTAAQAREVVELPGRHLLAEGATEAIVETFAASDAERPVADPALLSIFCWQLNEKRGPGEITAALAVAMRGEFVRQFYESAFAALPAGQAQGAHRFVETDLIDAAGFRTSAGFEHAEKKHGITAATLEHLVDARLLHPVDRSGGHRHVELVHDRIAEEAARQRTVREEAEAREREAETRRQEAEEAAAREAETRRREAEEKARLQADLAKARRRALLLGALALLSLAALIFAVIMAQRAKRAQETAEDAEGRAHTAQTAAEAANEKTNAALADAKLQKIEADRQRIEADKQRTTAETAAAVIAGEKTKADQARDRAVAARKSEGDLLTYMLDDLAKLLSKVGRIDMLKDVSEKVAAHLEKEKIPDGDIDGMHQRCELLSLQSIIAVAQGKLASALKFAREALVIQEEFRRQGDDTPKSKGELVRCYNALGALLTKAGDSEGALAAYQKGVDIARPLSELQPGNVLRLLLLAECYMAFGHAQFQMGDHKLAIETMQKGVEINEKLAKDAPDDTKIQIALARAHETMGTIYHWQELTKLSMPHYEKALNIWKQLTEKEPNNAGRQESLARSYQRMGDALSQGGTGASLKEASEWYQKSLAVNERLAQMDPGNAGWQTALAFSYICMGDVIVNRMKKGDKEANGNKEARRQASEWFRKSIDVREGLVKRDPANDEWAEDLALSYSRMGDMCVVEKATRNEGLKYFRKDLEITGRLAGRDGSNAQMQINWAKSCMGLGYWLSEGGSAKDHAESLKLRRQAVSILSPLLEKFPGHLRIEKELWFAEEALAAELSERDGSGDLKEAFMHAEAALKISDKRSRMEKGSTEWQEHLKTSKGRIEGIRWKLEQRK